MLSITRLFSYLFICCFFFFKQKTAYEMRISDWSSDVCSSDLRHAPLHPSAFCSCRPGLGIQKRLEHLPRNREEVLRRGARGARRRTRRGALPDPSRHRRRACPALRRSEEHTSELQSIMRISYAVFCLKKKKHVNQIVTAC